jgi:thymidylate synthase ThyX
VIEKAIQKVIKKDINRSYRMKLLNEVIERCYRSCSKSDANERLVDRSDVIFFHINFQIFSHLAYLTSLKESITRIYVQKPFFFPSALCLKTRFYFFRLS